MATETAECPNCGSTSFAVDSTDPPGLPACTECGKVMPVCPHCGGEFREADL